MTTVINCFKAYDVRGRVPEELNVNIAYRIGRAFAEFLSQNCCRWFRHSSNQLRTQ